MEAEVTAGEPGAALTAAGFRRELTPTWLHLACVLNGQRPPDLDGGFRYVYVGGPLGTTPAVVAAVHPQAQVWVWSGRASELEEVRSLSRRAGLANLDVHERPGLPGDLGGGLADLVVIDDVMNTTTDHARRHVVTAVGASLRPGGLVCIVYKPLVASTEIAPVQRVMRRIAQRHTGHPDELIPSVIDVLNQLRTGGARYLTERPAIAMWLDQLVADPSKVHDYLRDQLQPLSHPQLSRLVQGVGLTPVGSSDLSHDADAHVPSGLRDLVSNAPNPALREAYRDLIVRPDIRLDVFRRGFSPRRKYDWHASVAAIELVDLAPEAVPDDLLDDRPTSIRMAVDAGRRHPVSVGGSSQGAIQASRALGAELAARGTELIPTSVLGSALPTSTDARILALLEVG